MASASFMTPKGRLSFTQQLFVPKAFNGGKPKFSVTILFDAKARATAAYKALTVAAEEAKLERFGAKATGMKIKSPFLDGNEPDYAKYSGYEGCTFLRLSSEYKPDFCDRDGQQIPFDRAEDEIYSGVYARVTVNVFAYDTNGNRGVSFGLRNIQKLGDGDSLGGRTSAASEFGAVEADDADLDDEFSRMVG